MKLTLIGMAMASCMVGLSYELQNPALNPVKVKEAADTGTIELLKNSKADFAIVCDSSGEDAALPRRRSVTKAAELFKNVFNRCAGVNVPIIAPDKEAELAKYRYLLVVGPSRITEKLGINPAKLPPGGFVVRTFDRGVAVVGYDGSKMPAAYNHMDPGHYAINGTLNGAYDFVERFLGVRYYYPGYGTINNYEFGEAVVPRYIGQYLREFGKYFGNLQIIYCTDLDYTRYYAEYITYRSMWNPEFNVDAALDEQWKLLYGAAAPYVKEFYDLMSERWATVVAQKGSRQSAYNGQVLSKMEELLQKAVQAVKPDSIEMKRLLIFMKPWPGAIAKARRSFMFIKPSYSVKKLAASEKVAVDGKGEEKLWNNAAAVPFLNLNGTGNIKNPVHGKLVYDDKALYGLFEFAGEPRIVPNMWDCSNIELFLAPPDNSEYFQFVFFGDGRVFFGQKTLKPMVTPFNSKWPMPNLKYAVQKTENGWRLEFIIPFPDIKKDVPAAYSTWNGNIIFNPMQADKEIQAYSLTNGNNHEVECFGSIKFMGKGDL